MGFSLQSLSNGEKIGFAFCFAAFMYNAFQMIRLFQIHLQIRNRTADAFIGAFSPPALSLLIRRLGRAWRILKGFANNEVATETFSEQRIARLQSSRDGVLTLHREVKARLRVEAIENFTLCMLAVLAITLLVFAT